MIDAVVPVLNSIKTLSACFKAIRLAVPNINIIAVDGGSTDGSYEWLQKHADVAFRQRGTGIGEARSQGFKLVKGPWMITFDADVIFPPHWLHEVCKYIKPRVGSVSGHLIFGEGKVAEYYRNLYRIRKNVIYTTMGNNLIRTEAIRDCGGFSHLDTGEDKDTQLRLLKHGWKWVCIPGLEVSHPRTFAEDLHHNRWWGRGMARLYPNPVYGFGFTFINLLYTPHMTLKRCGGMNLLHILMFLVGYVEGWKYWTFRR